MTDPNRGFLLANQDVIAAPYALYDELRRSDPVHEVSEGVYLLTRYRDCIAALSDKRLSNKPAPFALLHQRNRENFVGADIAQSLIAFRDAPEVAAARKTLALEFVSFTKTLTPLLQDLAQKQLEAIRLGEDMDFVRDLALPYTMIIMCKVLGFPNADIERLKAWSADFFYLFHAIPDQETLVRLNESLAEFRAYTRALVHARRSAPENDLISQLSAIDPQILDETALVDNIMLLAADGVENVWAGMANALVVINKNNKTVQEVRDAGVTWTTAMTECLRLESPGQYQGRIATEELDIGGTTIRKYAVVLVGLAAANRDPDAFDAPEAFKIGRKGARDLAFGHGAHACLGKTLVYAQMSAFFEALQPYLPSLELDVTPDMWAGRAGHRWLSRLPVTFTAKSH